MKSHRNIKTLRIMLVENNEHDVIAFRRAFRKGQRSSEIFHYVRAEEALKRLLADFPSLDLAVINHQLPGMSGLDLCKELLRQEVPVPLVLMVEPDTEALAIEALNAGVDDYVIKDPNQGYLAFLPVFLPEVVRKYGYQRPGRWSASAKLRDQLSQGVVAQDPAELVFRFLPDGTLTSVNDAYCQYLGKAPKDLIGQNVMNFIPSEDLEEAESHLRSLERGDPVGSLEHRVVVSGGEIRWMHRTDRAIFDEQGGVTEFQSTGRDITERKEAEERLRQSEERYRSLVENTLDGFFVCDVPSGEILFINQRACDLLGYTMQETLTRSIWDMVDVEEHEILKERIQAGLDGKTQAQPRSNYTMRRKDGSKFVAEVSPSLVTFKGSPVLQGIFRDVTEQERIQNQLRQAHRMEGIATLAGGIAHQFNNALAAVTGNIGLLEMDFPDHETVGKYVQAMYEATRRMAHLTNQLLAFARGGRYKPEVLSLSEFVKDTLPLLRHTIDQDIQIRTDLAADICSVEADVAQMQMTLSAILSNAAEAMNGAGHIHISTRTQDIDEMFAKEHPGLSPGRYACLTVKDDGKGMDEQIRSRIFEPFFTTNMHGRGLGMAAVYGIVKSHGGWISVDSKPGRGTSVNIYLPESEKSPETQVEKPISELEYGEGTVLLIEDETAVADATKSILERMNYRVLEANSGTEALELADTYGGPIDLAILDMGLPDMRAKEVYAKLMDVRHELKVVLCSGYAMDGPAQELLYAGAQGFIQKPFTVNTLIGKIKDLLEKK